MLARGDGDGTLLAVRLQPRAARDEVVCRQGDTVRVRVTSPPVDGSANDALCRLLADRLGVARGTVAIRSGLRSRDKIVRVAGLAPDVVCERLGLGRPESA